MPQKDDFETSTRADRRKHELSVFLSYSDPVWELSSAALDEAFKRGDFSGAAWQPFLNLWRAPGRYAGRDDEVIAKICQGGASLPLGSKVSVRL